MARMKVVDGVSLPFTPEEEIARDAEEAAWAAGASARDKAAANAPVLAAIEAKELLALRSMRELRRAQEYADVPAADVAFAKNRLKALDDEIKALRGTLQP